MLYKGNKEDKALAKNYKRLEKFVGNVLVIDDPRDADVEDEYKVSGTVRLYEFPGTIESKLKNEITDKSEGYGMSVFDPEEGYDLIIKIKSKKPDSKGKVWPDYSDTQFSRKPSSIGSEKEIEEIIGKTVLLEEYVKESALTWEEHEKLLKLEGYWEDVSEDFERRTGKKSTETKEVFDKVVEPEKSEKPTSKKEVKKEEVKEEIKIDSDDMSDEDLLKELQNM